VLRTDAPAGGRGGGGGLYLVAGICAPKVNIGEIGEQSANSQTKRRVREQNIAKTGIREQGMDKKGD